MRKSHPIIIGGKPHSTSFDDATWTSINQLADANNMSAARIIDTLIRFAAWAPDKFELLQNGEETVPSNGWEKAVWMARRNGLRNPSKLITKLAHMAALQPELYNFAEPQLESTDEDGDGSAPAAN